MPSISRKKDLGVVTLLVTTKRARASFFCQESSFFAHALLLFLSGDSGSFCIFYIYCEFNFVLFSFYLSLLIPTCYILRVKMKFDWDTSVLQNERVKGKSYRGFVLKSPMKNYKISWFKKKKKKIDRFIRREEFFYSKGDNSDFNIFFFFF